MAIEPEDRPKNMTEFRDLLDLLPAATSLPEIPTLSFSEALQPIQNLPERPVVVMPIANNPPPGLTASIPTKSKTTKDAQNPLNPSIQPVVTISEKESTLPGLTASISPPAKPTGDIKKKEEPVRSTRVQGDRSLLPEPAPHPNQKPSKKTSPVNRRFILQGLLETRELAGFGFARLLLKNLFNSQPTSQPIAQGNTAFASETIQSTTVKPNNQGKVITTPTGTAQIYKEDLGNGVSLTMVKIPAGSFMMGSPASKKQSPQHRVNLKAFYLGQTEISQAQYQAIMGTNPSNFKGTELPVEQVSWLNAKEFCKKLSQKADKTYSLPSESQWEYACRSGTTTPFAFGETITANTANYNSNYIYGKVWKDIYMQTTVVGIFPPNAFGIFDMHGNVWEWCEDIWHGNYQAAPVDGSSWGKNNNNDSQVIRVLRGGSWIYNHHHCSSAYRSRGSAGSLNNNIGFRVVCAQDF